MYIKMKHRVSLLILVVAVMIVAFAVCTSATNGKFEMSVESLDSTGASMESGAIVKKDDEISINVKIDNNPGILAAVFDLKYDKTVMVPVSDEATFVKEFTTTTEKYEVRFQFRDGYIRYTLMPLYVDTVEDTGILFTIKFKIVGTSDVTTEAPISISLGQILDGNVTEIECGEPKSTSVKLHNKHTEKVTAAVPSTCYSEGFTEEIVCSDCGEIIKEKISTGYLQHNMVVTAPAIEPTCTTVGRTEGSKCQNTGCTHTIEPIERPMISHKYVTVEAKAPTCFEFGWSAYEKCENEGCSEKKGYVAKDPLNHVGMITDYPEQPATTTATGLTAGKQCYNCQTWIQPRVEIPMIVEPPVEPEPEPEFPWVWVIVGITVVAVAVVVVVYFTVIKKKSYKEDYDDYDDDDEE